MSKCFCRFVFCVALALSAFGQNPVFINEFMASNQTGLQDENGERWDWIELRNTSGAAVNLQGYFLTDKASNLKLWEFPSVSIPANGYLIVYASGEDRVSPRLHSNFSLNVDGDYLGFVKPDGVTIISEFRPEYPQQYRDYSYGYDSTGQTFVYFLRGTPGAANSGGVIAFAADTKFSQDRGFYTAPFDLSITTETEGATIRYTTNGTVPTLSNGFTYSPGVGIKINGTTVLRASAFKTGFQPSNPDTQTYLFLNDVIRQASDGAAPPGWPANWGGNVTDYGMDPDVVNDPVYRDTIVNDMKTLPSFSIVMNVDDLFNANTGIYSHPGNDGRDWERPCSVEYIRTDGVEGFQVNAGLRIRGGFSRSTSNPKHALRLFFREEYGDAKLNYPLFGDNGADEFNNLDLRTFQNYSWSFQGDANGVFIRDVFSRDTQLAMGHQAERGDYCHLYINGMYWGIYNTCERPEASFAETYFGGQKENYDVIKVEAGIYQINPTDGDMNAWTELYNQAAAGLASNAAYFKVQGKNPDGTVNPAYKNLVDVDNLIDYMLVIFYGGNKDAPISNFLGNDRPNNWYGMRDRTGNSGFRFIAHDSEHTLLPGDINIDRTGPFVAGQNGLLYSNPQYVFTQLSGNAEFRLRVADHIHKHYFNNGLLTPVSATARFNIRRAQLDRAVVAESARWGDAKRATPLKRSDWVAACNNVLNNFLPQRSGVTMAQYRNQGWYPNVAAPSFNQHGGNVASGFSLTLTAPAGTIFYTLDGSDPRLLGGTVSPAATAYSGALGINNSIKVKSRALSGGVWSALNEAEFYVIRNYTGLLITEINYHPITPEGVEATELEFIELKNASATEMDLSGLRFTNGIAYTFPLGKKLAAGKFVTLVRNPEAFALRYPTVAIDGAYTNKLADSGETISLIHASGAPIISMTYSDDAPWPSGADGAGFTLVSRNPNLNPDPNSAGNWRASSALGGSPGQDDPSVNILPVVINEVLTHTDPPLVDFIELYNPNNAAVDVGGWYLTDDRLTPKKFRITGPHVINPQSYTVFTEPQFNSTPGAGTSFALSSHGDEVYLYSADSVGNLTGYSDGFSFGGAENPVTFGRYTNSVGEVSFPAQIQNSEGAVNAGPRIGPVVINEIRYHPRPGDEEFIELRNLTAAPIKLFDENNPANRWELSGIDFTFPANAEIPAGGYAVIASVEPSLFRTHNTIPANVPVFGPFNGALQDDGELIELRRPDAPDQELGGPIVVPYITVDAVRYNDRTPWPIAANGDGPSLERINSSAFGNDPINWRASAGSASPGINNDGNRPPQINAGPDEAKTSTTFPLEVTLAPTVTDDGLPAPSTLTFSWTQVSGPGVVVFNNPSARNAVAGLPGVGVYVLQVAVSDGEYETSDEIEFEVSRPTTGVTYVSKGSQWRYLDDGSDQGVAWRGEGFVDTTWKQGAAQLGFGNNGEVTTINAGPANARYITTYFRRTFNVPSVAGLRDLTVRVVRDDGPVVWLNGKQIFVDNFTEGVTITASTYARDAIADGDENVFYSRPVSVSDLKVGLNTIAVEMHQVNASSSDLSFDLELVGQVSSQNAAPVVTAGPDLTITLPASAQLGGFVQDDGLPLPPGAPANTWTKVSGPGTVTFDNAASPVTTARFSSAGAYVLQLTSNDGEFTVQDQMTVQVNGGDAYATWKGLHFNSAELGNPQISGDDADPDGDTFNNRDEFIAGTDPRDPESYLGLDADITQTGMNVVLEAMPDRTYDILMRDSLDSGLWELLRSVPPGQNPQTINVQVDTPADRPTRFFRVAIPQ